jgi:hypothetical protein
MGDMISELTAQFSVAGQKPNTALARWRASRPEWLGSHFKEISDSYNSVTWEQRHTQLLMKLVGGSFFGGQTVDRLTALFEDNGHGGSTITVNGSADPKTRAAIRSAAEKYYEGGIV